MVNMVAFILMVGIFGFCSGLDIELSKEGPCLNPPPDTVPFNPAAFMDKSITLFTPLLSKYDLYRQIQDVAGKKKLQALAKNEIDKSCLTFAGGEQNTFCVSVFDGAERCYEFGPGSTTSLRWRAEGHTHWEGESWVTKTNQDYFVTVNCWANGERSFAVNAVKSKLPKEDMDDIKKHLQSLGFKSEYFYQFNYELCPQSNRRKEL